MPFSTSKDIAALPRGPEAPSAPSFEPFSWLPRELRQQIWQLALSPTGVNPGVCVLPPDFKSMGKGSQLTVRNPYSTLMGTSQEARQTALERLPLTRNYDPETDILYVSADSFYIFCDMCRKDDWPSFVQHLALALPVAERGAWLPIAMKKLVRLQTISVVYPKATGEVDVHEDVSLPKQAHKMLRRFTDEEMDAFKIKADYLHESHGRDIPIVWSMSTQEHLDFVREVLTRLTGRDRPPCWDDETESLGLTFEASCFEVAGEL